MSSTATARGAWAERRGQARFYADRLWRQTVAAPARWLSPAARHDLVRALEVADSPLEISLQWNSRRVDACLVESRTVAPSTSLVVPPDAVHAVHTGHVWPELRVHRLRDVIVDVYSGLVFHDGRVLAASGHGWRSAGDGAFLCGAAARVREGRPHHRAGAVTPCGEVANFGHFLLETVPRLLRVGAVAPEAVAVFPARPPAFAVQILDALGVSFTVEEGTALRTADDVWLCDPCPTGWPHPDDLALLRDRFGDDFRGEPDTDVYVSRRGLSRAPANVAELERRLVAEGFVILRPQELTVREQIAAYRRARVLVGDFGSGLTNTVFMAPGATVVDLTSGDWWTPHFRNIAAVRGLRYVTLTLPATPAQPHGDALAALTDILAAR